MSRKRVIGLAVSVVGIILLAASQAFSSAPADAPGRDGAVAAQERLFEAVERTRGVDLALAVRLGEDDIAGRHEVKRGASGFRHGSGMEFVTTADVLYVRGAPGVPDGKWAWVAAGSIAAACELAAVVDPLFALSVLRAATSVEPDGELGYRGVSDLAKVTGSPATLKTAEYFSAILAEGRSEVRFSVTTNQAGYVVSVALAFTTSGGDFHYGAELSDFGRTVSVPVPTDAVEAPPELYK